MSTNHPYIAAFIAALAAGGHAVIEVKPQPAGHNEIERVRVKVARRRGPAVEFNAWVERRANLHTGHKFVFGYVDVAHDVTLGRPRLIDWTNLSDGGTFNPKANGAGEAVRRALA